MFFAALYSLVPEAVDISAAARLCKSKQYAGSARVREGLVAAASYYCMASARRPGMPYSTGSLVEFPLTSMWINVVFC